MTTNSSTRFENGSAADLALNVKVGAEGQIVEARVDSVDRAANKLVVLGIDVTVNANTRIEDKRDQRVPNFKVGNLLLRTVSSLTPRVASRK